MKRQSIKRIKLCLVIPLCNEEESMPILHDRLEVMHQLLSRTHTIHYLFVDDGSTDQTGRLIPDVVPRGATYHICTHLRNRGLGAAFRTAFQHAHADVVCTIDADCSYGPENLPPMIQQIHYGLADIVVASPYHPEGAVEGVQAWRRLLSAQCSNLYRLISPVRLHTYTSIFRVYRGSLVSSLEFRSDGFVAVVEMLFSAAKQGYRIAEEPLTLRRRTAGASKMRIAKTIRDHTLLMIRCCIGKLALPAHEVRSLRSLPESHQPTQPDVIAKAQGW